MTCSVEWQCRDLNLGLDLKFTTFGAVGRGKEESAPDQDQDSLNDVTLCQASRVRLCPHFPIFFPPPRGRGDAWVPEGNL